MRAAAIPISRRKLLALCAACVPLSAAGENAVAIVVRPDVPVDNLSFAELRRLMLGDQQYWSSSMRVTLLVRAPGAREREVVLKEIYKMSEAQFQQYWIAKVFREEATSGPRIVYSTEMVAELTAAIRGAVGFVDATQIPPGLKVLKLNGLPPGDARYPLR